MGIDDALVLERGHACRARRVIERLHGVAHELRDLGVAELVQVVVPERALVAGSVDGGLEGLLLGDAREQAGAAHKGRDVLLVREISLR